MPFILIIIFLLLFGSCTSSIRQEDFENIPVVEGYLRKGEPISIKISQQIPLDGNGAVHTLDNLTLVLYEDDARIELTSQGNGIYKSTSLVQENKTYKLSFEYNNKITTAETTIPSEPVDYEQSVTSIKGFNPNNLGMGGGFPSLTSVVLKWKNPNQGYYIVVIENVATTLELINTNSESNNLSRAFRISPTQGTSIEIRPMQFTYYGNHELRLYHVNSDYSALYNTGNNTSQNLYTPTTTITNGVGIFTGMSHKTLMLNVYK